MLLEDLTPNIVSKFRKLNFQTGNMNSKKKKNKITKQQIYVDKRRQCLNYSFHTQTRLKRALVHVALARRERLGRSILQTDFR